MAIKKELTRRDHVERFFYFHPEIGCMGRIFLVSLPVLADIALWHLAIQFSDSDLLGAAFVGAPIALLLSMALAQH